MRSRSTVRALCLATLVLCTAAPAGQGQQGIPVRGVGVRESDGKSPEGVSVFLQKRVLPGRLPSSKQGRQTSVECSSFSRRRQVSMR